TPAREISVIFPSSLTIVGVITTPPVKRILIVRKSQITERRSCWTIAQRNKTKLGLRRHREFPCLVDIVVGLSRYARRRRVQSVSSCSRCARDLRAERRPEVLSQPHVYLYLVRCGS